MSVGSLSFKGNVVSHNSAKELLPPVSTSDSLDKSYFAKMLAVTPEDVFSAQDLIEGKNGSQLVVLDLKKVTLEEAFSAKHITEVEDGSRLVVLDLGNGLRVSAKPDFVGFRRILMLPDGNSISNYWSFNAKTTQRFENAVAGIFNHLSEIAKNFKQKMQYNKAFYPPQAYLLYVIVCSNIGLLVKQLEINYGKNY